MRLWDDAVHALGVAEMDATHREFLALLALLADCDDADFAGLFGRLLEHCRAHFTNEGRLMRLSRFPALNEHEGEHHRVYGDLMQMHRAVQRGRVALARAFVKQGLEEWFAQHLVTMDSALAGHLKRMETTRVDMSGGLPVLG